MSVAHEAMKPGTMDEWLRTNVPTWVVPDLSKAMHARPERQGGRTPVSTGAPGRTTMET